MAGLYIHIPFCSRRCGYCDFFSTTALDSRGEYVRAAAEEIGRQAGFLPTRKLDTIYIGGGTPSLLGTGELALLWEAVGRVFELSNLREATLEANPDDLAEEYLRALAALPFDRLSIGVQSFDDEVLRLMGRRHTAAAAEEAIRLARAAGFDNISADLIYGVPGMSRASWEASVRRMIAIKPEHISAYHLGIEDGTPFARQGMEPVDEAEGQAQYDLICTMLAAAGYEHYEISNFALPGRRARHNNAYWAGEPYLGIGPGAHSYDGDRTRRWCSQTLAQYLAGPAHESETLSDTDLYNEYVMTSLRTAEGADPAVIEARFGARRLQEFTSRTGPLLAAGMLAQVGEVGNYAVPEDKMLLSDAVIRSLFA